MNAQSVFLGSLLTMIICNLLLFSTNPTSYLNDLYNGGMVSALALLLVAVVIGGINILGSGLTGASVKLIFSVCAMLLLLFRIDVSFTPNNQPSGELQSIANQIVLATQSGANWLVSVIMQQPQPVTAQASGISIGFGLLTRIYNVFLFYGDLWNIGLILTGVIGLLFIGSALIMIVEGHGE